MIKSKFFWLGAILLSIIPLLVMDLPKHYLDWRSDVRDQMIEVTQNGQAYTTHQRAAILEHILYADKTLMAKLYLKSFTAIILLALGFYFLRLYYVRTKPAVWKPILTGFILFAFAIAVKFYSWTSFAGNGDIKLLTYSPADTRLENIYQTNFKGKVVYVDFWGTTCPPCLEEFRNFTKPLKEKYDNRHDIAWLHICEGREFVWKQQLQKFDITGWHLFLNSKDFNKLFLNAVRGSKDTSITIPRYVIMDKTGKIVDQNAPRPGNVDSVTLKLNKYLAVN